MACTTPSSRLQVGHITNLWLVHPGREVTLFGLGFPPALPDCESFLLHHLHRTALGSWLAAASQVCSKCLHFLVRGAPSPRHARRQQAAAVMRAPCGPDVQLTASQQTLLKQASASASLMHGNAIPTHAPSKQLRDWQGPQVRASPAWSWRAHSSLSSKVASSLSGSTSSASAVRNRERSAEEPRLDASASFSSAMSGSSRGHTGTLLQARSSMTSVMHGVLLQVGCLYGVEGLSGIASWQAAGKSSFARSRFIMGHSCV